MLIVKFIPERTKKYISKNGYNFIFRYQIISHFNKLYQKNVDDDDRIEDSNNTKNTANCFKSDIIHRELLHDSFVTFLRCDFTCGSVVTSNLCASDQSKEREEKTSKT